MLLTAQEDLVLLVLIPFGKTDNYEISLHLVDD